MFKIISNILELLGISPGREGFHYLLKIIYICYLNPTLLKNMSKNVYPRVAKEFHKTVSAIEKGIRTAIESGWNRSDYEYANELFKNSLDPNKLKPTNVPFIRTIVRKITLIKEITIY